MYKVFVDHKPVIFIEKKEITNNCPVLEANKIVSFKKEVHALLKNASIDCDLMPNNSKCI